MQQHSQQLQGAHWYVLRAKPKREFWASALLAKASIEVYVPELRLQKQRGKPISVEPFFPGYFFGRLCPENGDFRLASYTSGVMYILGYDGHPCPVPDKMIEAIQRRLSAANGCLGQGEFHQGDTVQITSGPFEGMEAVFDCQLSGTGRVRVLIKTLNRVWRAEAHIGQLRRTTQAARSVRV